MIIDVKNRSKDKSITTYRLKKICKSVLENLAEIEGLENPEVSVLFIDDDSMQSLNLKYRKIDSSTDVLSFPMCDGRFPNVGPNILGDIVISIPYASRQAMGNNHDLEEEICHLLIHGFLHLIGYDDEDRVNRDEMLERERELRSALLQRDVI